MRHRADNSGQKLFPCRWSRGREQPSWWRKTRNSKESIMQKCHYSGQRFEDTGTVTAANSSTLNDGASAVLLMGLSEANKRGIKPLAEILSYADAETDPREFTIAPSLAIPMALERAGLTKEQVDLWEINEAFSVVVLANQKVCDLL